MDQKAIFDKQISEFLLEFKNRFNPIQPYMGMPGKQGYAAKINRQDINSSLQVFITDKFPYEPPIFMVAPKFNHEIVFDNGRVVDDCLRRWNMMSTLKGCVNEILSKLEGRMQSQYKSPIPTNQNANLMMSNEDDSAIIKDLTDDLNKKSIEELIYINFNPEHYVAQFTQAGRAVNEALLNEVKELSRNYEAKKSQYDVIKSNIENCKNQYEQKERELRDLYNQKQQIDGQITVERLMEEMRKFIDENFQRPRQKLINEFMTKKIPFETFQEQFKDLTMKYHYYSIIRDKLNLCK